ncbi:MAG: hypothetical protein FWE83_08755 [Oscillospiraceae bacterium]|nr:hypothetical protein [Oscillospiraceae bacterium]
MENNQNINFEEARDDEINDVWDIFFPKASERTSIKQGLDLQEQTKPRRYLKFLTM